MSEQPTSGPNNPTAGTDGDWYLPYVVAAAVAAGVGGWLGASIARPPSTWAGLGGVFALFAALSITTALLSSLLVAAIVKRFNRTVPILVTALLAFQSACWSATALLTR